MHFDKTSQNLQPATAKKPATQRKKQPIVQENHPIGNTDYGLPLTRDKRTVKFLSPSPILIRKSWIRPSPVCKNHQSDPVLICPYKTMYFILSHEAK